MNFREIDLDNKTQKIKFDANRGETGRAIGFIVKQDLTNYLVYNQTKIRTNPDGTNVLVVTRCNVVDGHFVSFGIEPNVTANPGIYESQLIVYGSPQSPADEWPIFKQQMLAGNTQVMVENPKMTGTQQSQVVENYNVKSFPYEINVIQSVDGAGTGSDIYETAITELRKLIAENQALNTSLQNAIKNAQTATTSANEASVKATQSASVCDTATTNAIQATSEATNAATSANNSVIKLGTLEQDVTDLKTFKTQVTNGNTAVVIEQK